MPIATHGSPQSCRLNKIPRMLCRLADRDPSSVIAELLWNSGGSFERGCLAWPCSTSGAHIVTVGASSIAAQAELNPGLPPGKAIMLIHLIKAYVLIIIQRSALQRFGELCAAPLPLGNPRQMPRYPGGRDPCMTGGAGIALQGPSELEERAHLYATPWHAAK
ncbi:hypothetical protein SKAU_G00262200 [Synaphobranchus kaupii]|uniref:Uncharacterized protein n=1 Tax=Synaphobranchus kaupii TaxID=118154 RepID=A0A9Q1EYQ5_SYNKA|nr:hypothetical protein SKAU_G00262200 [Synaphobranchus kaupii]